MHWTHQIWWVYWGSKSLPQNSKVPLLWGPMEPPFFYPSIPQSVPVQLWSEMVLQVEQLKMDCSVKILDITHLKLTKKMRHKHLEVRILLPGAAAVICHIRWIVIEHTWAPLFHQSTLWWILCTQHHSFTNITISCKWLHPHSLTRQ